MAVRVSCIIIIIILIINCIMPTNLDTIHSVVLKIHIRSSLKYNIVLAEVAEHDSILK